jgi:hypothetical protein
MQTSLQFIDYRYLRFNTDQKEVNQDQAVFRLISKSDDGRALNKNEH